MQIILLTPKHPLLFFKQVAEMHAAEIQHGLLPKLGTGFMAALYRAVSDSPQGRLIAVTEGEALLGFLAGSTDLRLMYRHILLKHGAQLLWHALPKCFAAGILAKVWTVFSYPARRPIQDNVPRASGKRITELLAIAVSATFRRQGLGTRLLTQFEKQLQSFDQLVNYRVATNAAEIASNTFYTSHGFRFVGNQVHNDLTLRIYTKTIQPAGHA